MFILFLVLFLLAGAVFYWKNTKQEFKAEIIDIVTARGDSLVPLLNVDDEIKIVYGYYDSHSVKREDIVAYEYAGNDVPIVKIVKAVPGDKWRLEYNETDKFYKIIVNDEVLRNSEDKDYKIAESSVKMLKLYTKSYPVIPNDAYLILGNKIEGSLDATRFGLIGKSGILGKVEIIQKSR